MVFLVMLNRYRNCLWLSCVLLVSGCTKDDVTFSKLRMNRRDTTKAQIYAAELKETPGGIKRAIKDMDCYGGSTGGWSSWILEQSSLAADIDEPLKELLRAQGEPLTKRIEAAIVLWNRTHDRRYLSDLFLLVRPPGPPVIGHGRRKLTTLIDFGELRSKIALPAEENLQVSAEEFNRYVRTHGSAPVE
jgi:hypothetical protein